MLLKNNSKFIAYSWLGLVTLLLCLPGKEFPSITWLSKLNFDKWVHFILFFVLVFVFCGIFRGKRSGQVFLLIAFLGFVYGICMEFVQRYLIPYRSFDPVDIVANGIGCLAGYLFAARMFLKK